MAVSITSNMTLINGADNITGWSGGTSYSGFQRQGAGCLGTQASSGTSNLYYTLGSATDMSDHTVFVWMRSGNPTNEANGGFRIILGDGTNRIAYYVGGSDNFGFFVGGWSCFKLNTTNLPTNFATLQGSEANLNTASITEVGAEWNYASKANGNADNVFVDVMRYVPNGTPALVVDGGSSGDEGTFGEIATEDDSTVNAWGIVTSLVAGSKAYRVNFGIDIGNDASSDSYFGDSDAQIFFTGTNMATGAMDLNILSNSTGTNSFSLINSTLISIGTACNVDYSGANQDILEIDSCQFSNFGTFNSPATDIAGRFIDNTIFNSCGIITVGGLSYDGCAFNTATDDAITTSDATTFNVINSSFDNPTNHGVEITATGTYEFNGLTFTNTDGVSNYDVENTTAGSVTINATGGSDPTDVDNSGGGTTTINNNVNVTLEGLVNNTEVRVYQAGTTTEIAGQEDVTNGTFSFSTGAGQDVDIRIFAISYEPESLLSFTIPTTDTTIPIDQRFDRNYENP